MNNENDAATRAAKQERIQRILQPLILDDETLHEICRRMIEAMKKGLDPNTKHESSLKMLNTYVRQLPTGKEKGQFLALDLGGTNFRVLLITLSEECTMDSKIYAIDNQHMLGPGHELFDYIADCLKTFIEWRKIGHLRLPLGFTFSFPCTQEALTRAKLIRWTKGFRASGVVDQDVVALLDQALERKGVDNIEVTAILNDTTGTLMSCAYQNPNCQLGLILGTGTNACYVERLDNVLTWSGPRDEPNQVLINMEWGAFGDCHELDFILTEYDIDIDRRSLNANQQIFEKLISGMYLGEIVRVVLLKLANEGLLFDGLSTSGLQEPYKFFTKAVSEIEGEPQNVHTKCREILVEIGLKQVSDEDCAVVRKVCELVSRRAASLSSAGIAAVLKKIGKASVTVGVDGSLYRHHPTFKAIMETKIAQLLPPGIKFELMLSEDGSGRGAALVAAVASQALH